MLSSGIIYSTEMIVQEKTPGSNYFGITETLFKEGFKNHK